MEDMFNQDVDWFVGNSISTLSALTCLNHVSSRKTKDASFTLQWRRHGVGSYQLHSLKDLETHTSNEARHLKWLFTLPLPDVFHWAEWSGHIWSTIQCYKMTMVDDGSSKKCSCAFKFNQIQQFNSSKLVSIGWSTKKMAERETPTGWMGFQDSRQLLRLNGSSSIINCGNQYNIIIIYKINTDWYRLIHLIVVWCWWICETDGNLMSSVGSPLRTKDGNTCRIWPTCMDLILASTIRFTVEKYMICLGACFGNPRDRRCPGLFILRVFDRKGMKTMKSLRRLTLHEWDRGKTERLCPLCRHWFVKILESRSIDPSFIHDSNMNILGLRCAWRDSSCFSSSLRYGAVMHGHGHWGWTLETFRYIKGVWYYLAIWCWTLLGPSSTIQFEVSWGIMRYPSFER